MLDTKLGAMAHDAAHRLHALTVPLHAGQSALLRPATVAIHDDGDVPRDRAHFGDAHRRC